MSETNSNKRIPTGEWVKKYKKKLYHWTYKDCLESILKEGLKPSGFGIIYLSPRRKKPYFGSLYRNNQKYEVLLKVETGDKRLSAFEGCREWEVLCWGSIPPEDIIVLKAR